MKKKLLALLLASSMALMNVAPAYGTDIFTDPDNAANEDVISVPEELVRLITMESSMTLKMSLLRNRQMMISFRMKRKCLLFRRGTRWLQMQGRE